MASPLKRNWKLSFRQQPDGHSPDQPNPHEGAPPSYSDRLGQSSNAVKDLSYERDYDSVSVTSTKPPSYRSQSTLRAPQFRSQMPMIADRATLPFQMALDLLPVPIIIEISNYLPISAWLCLRYTSKTFFQSLEDTSESLLSFERFSENPKYIRVQRALLLAHLEQDSQSLFRWQFAMPDVESANERKEKSRLQTTRNCLTCSACGIRHHYLAFADSERGKSPFQRRCTGSTRVMHICSHIVMTWDRFSSDIVDGRHTYEREANLFTAQFPSNNGLSSKDMELRHSSSSICQSWEGDIYAQERPVPAGKVVFHSVLEEPIRVHTKWLIDTEILRNGLDKAVSGKKYFAAVAAQEFLSFSGIGHKRAQSDKYLESIRARVTQLITRLESFDIYLCPHTKFSQPIFAKDLEQLITSNFAHSPPVYSYCPRCEALFHIGVDVVGKFLQIIIVRPIGTGESAMDSMWTAGTHPTQEYLSFGNLVTYLRDYDTGRSSDMWPQMPKNKSDPNS